MYYFFYPPIPLLPDCESTASPLISGATLSSQAIAGGFCVDQAGILAAEGARQPNGQHYLNYIP